MGVGSRSLATEYVLGYRVHRPFVVVGFEKVSVPVHLNPQAAVAKRRFVPSWAEPHLDLALLPR
jgi:hypothetical protein